MHHIHLIGAKAVLLGLTVALSSEKCRHMVAELYRQLDVLMTIKSPDAVGAVNLLNQINDGLYSILQKSTLPLTPKERAGILTVQASVSQSIQAIRVAA